MPFKSHKLAEKGQHKKQQEEILTINLIRKIMSDKKNGIPIEGLQDEIDMASIFAKAKNLYKKALQNQEDTTLPPLHSLKEDVLQKEKEMKQTGAKLLVNLTKEAKTLDKVAIIFQHNANALTNSNKKEMLLKAVNIAQKKALEAHILVKNWEKVYNIKDAISHQEPNMDEFGPFFISDY